MSTGLPTRFDSTCGNAAASSPTLPPTRTVRSRHFACSSALPSNFKPDIEKEQGLFMIYLHQHEFSALTRSLGAFRSASFGRPARCCSPPLRSALAACLCTRLRGAFRAWSFAPSRASRNSRGGDRVLKLGLAGHSFRHCAGGSRRGEIIVYGIADRTRDRILIIRFQQLLLLVGAVEETHLHEAAGGLGIMGIGRKHPEPLCLDPAVAPFGDCKDACLHMVRKALRACGMARMQPCLGALRRVPVGSVERDGDERRRAMIARDMR